MPFREFRDFVRQGAGEIVGFRFVLGEIEEPEFALFRLTSLACRG
jgi:hypothetical protein